jgi:hypothetical protein
VIRTAADALILFSVLMALPGRYLLLASFRQINFRTRLAAIIFYQFGSALLLIWLLSQHGWEPVLEALETMREAHLYGWVASGMFLMALVSPIVTFLFVWDSRRYPYEYVMTPQGRLLLPRGILNH